ncbi:MAG: hypothetical protein Q9163_001221 [Psora crenata]
MKIFALFATLAVAGLSLAQGTWRIRMLASPTTVTAQTIAQFAKILDFVDFFLEEYKDSDTSTGNLLQPSDLSDNDRTSSCNKSLGPTSKLLEFLIGRVGLGIQLNRTIIRIYPVHEQQLIKAHARCLLTRESKADEAFAGIRVFQEDVQLLSHLFALGMITLIHQHCGLQVAKELLENSLDAGATSIEVRFKTNGLDSIEVQDNGVGISKDDYEGIALKHHTSKLAVYDDLSTLQTFGFRGEALSSLCALSNLHIVTARESEAPKGTRLDFELSGKLKSTSIVASQKGTTVYVENLFFNLPVRRRELEKNIKREYGKVLGILQAYACISTQARISVSNVMAKGKKVAVFATRSNNSYRDNIANVFGAKTLASLVPINLNLELGHTGATIYGEGRQAPDRQMFFVNSRPCGLPQVAKVFNEVYKSYNMSQSPFIFANILLDTNAYDVNVSPDKRTILLHEQAKLLESLKDSLIDLFERQDQTVPHSRPPMLKLLSSEQLTVGREPSAVAESDFVDSYIATDECDLGGRGNEDNLDGPSPPARPDEVTRSLIGNFASRRTTDRVEEATSQNISPGITERLPAGQQKLFTRLGKENNRTPIRDQLDHARDSPGPQSKYQESVQGHNERTGAQPAVAQCDKSGASSERMDDTFHSERRPRAPSTTGVIQNAFDRMRSRRKSPEVATITIGSETTTSILGSPIYGQRKANEDVNAPPELRGPLNGTIYQTFSSGMQAFAAPASNLTMKVGGPQMNSRPLKPQFGDLSERRASADTCSSNDSAKCGEYQTESQLGEYRSEPENDEAVDQSTSEQDSDDDYLDEDGKKALEDAKVADMIRQAEEAAALTSQDSNRRAQQVLKGSSRKDSTTELTQKIDTSVERINQQLRTLRNAVQRQNNDQFPTTAHDTRTADLDSVSHPDHQALTISKADFHKMPVIGQFNLGFILATRNTTDLFIIDQHASDEKVNFERLEATTMMQNQQLMHPRRLELTAVDEEIVLENQDAFLRNGFVLDVDDSGVSPVGQRVSLISLPMSKGTTFTPSDFEELIALLADSPNPSSSVPRPTKIRKLLAMRACRSSIMIGRAMTKVQMQKLVSKMGDIDKPWNCPHGRPTMRHICDLEGMGGVQDGGEARVDWKGWIQRAERAASEGEVDDGTSELEVAEAAEDDG